MRRTVSWVVLLRGANVGGHRTFRPTELVAALPDLALRSIGAAGTFVAGTARPESKVRASIRATLPFDASVTVVPGAAVARLLERPPSLVDPHDPTERRFATVSDKPLPGTPRVPIIAPSGDAWQVRIQAVHGPFAVGVSRRFGPRVLYPSEVVEKAFGVPATTRWWETMEAIGRCLKDVEGPSEPGSPAVLTARRSSQRTRVAAALRPGAGRAAGRRSGR